MPTTLHQIPRVNILGVGLSCLNLESAEHALYTAVDTEAFQGFVTITGVHGVVESQRDEELKRIHNRSYLSTPDGMPMVWLAKGHGYDFVDRVYGPELMKNIMASSDLSGHRHYFFGGAEGVAEALTSSLHKEFPQLQVVGTMTPPFRPLTEAEENNLYEELQKKRPHFLWVGLSTPKQERFAHDFLEKFPDLTKDWDHGIIFIGVGAAFDFHSGRVQQAPYWIQRSGFEWLYRITQDPKRLLKRYVIANTYFLTRIFLQLTGMKHYQQLK